MALLLRLTGCLHEERNQLLVSNTVIRHRRISNAWPGLQSISRYLCVQDPVLEVRAQHSKDTGQCCHSHHRLHGTVDVGEVFQAEPAVLSEMDAALLMHRRVMFLCQTGHNRQIYDVCLCENLLVAHAVVIRGAKVIVIVGRQLATHVNVWHWGGRFRYSEMSELVLLQT